MQTGATMPLTHIPCAPGDHIGEQIAREYLVNAMPESQSFLLTNYHHPAGNGTEEHDLLLINERGVWCIEVKHWVGAIDADEIHWLHKGHRQYSPVTSIETKAKSIYSALAEAGLRDVSVVGLVVLTRHDTRWKSKPPPEHMRKIFRLTQPLIEAVSGRDYLYNPNKNRDLSSTMREAIKDKLVTIKVDPQRKIVGSFRLLRELEPGEHYRQYEAQHVLLGMRRARVKSYRVTDYESQEDIEEGLQRFVRDIEALDQLRGHTHIVQAYDFLPDPATDDTYWLMLEWIEGGTLHDQLEDGTALTFAEQIRILRSLTRALDACHQRGIIHRNLTPASVYLADDHTVKLGDFDFARVPAIAQTISKTGVPLASNRYTAPELVRNPRDADSRADLYGLGAIWYDMLFCPATEEPILPTKIKQASIPADALEFLRSLLSARPDDRPTSVHEVNEWLELLGEV
jgi:tRNA A-37 threonylcarbamoyl transferase component Bud32